METKDRGKLGIDLNKYEDGSGLTLRRMHFGLWLSENRKKIMRAIIIFLIAASAVMFIYSIYNYIFYFLYGKDADSRLIGDLTSSLVESQAYRESNTPKPLVISEVTVYPVFGKYDFLVLLQNPNAKHFSGFRYCLRSNDVDIACGDSFILPSSEKYLVIPGIETDSRPVDVRLVINNLFWQRLNAHQIPDWQEYSRMRLDFQVSELSYDNRNTGGRASFHNVSFKIKNDSPYSYLSLPLNILLYNGQTPSGMNVYAVENFMSGETREVNISWPSAGERVTRAEVYPDVNILDGQVFLPYRGN